MPSPFDILSFFALFVYEDVSVCVSLVVFCSLHLGEAAVGQLLLADGLGIALHLGQRLMAGEGHQLVCSITGFGPAAHTGLLEPVQATACRQPRLAHPLSEVDAKAVFG